VVRLIRGTLAIPRLSESWRINPDLFGSVSITKIPVIPICMPNLCAVAATWWTRPSADAFEAWDRAAVESGQRRREHARARDVQAKRLLSNIGTCVPHGTGPASAVSQQPAKPPEQSSASPAPEPATRN
jgi:hypothetical protein